MTAIGSLGDERHGPFLSVGEVTVYALGQDRFRVVRSDGEREVEGFEPARQLAHELAASL